MGFNVPTSTFVEILGPSHAEHFPTFMEDVFGQFALIMVIVEHFPRDIKRGFGQCIESSAFFGECYTPG